MTACVMSGVTDDSLCHEGVTDDNLCHEWCH